MKNEFQITKKLIMSWAKGYYLRGAIQIILLVLWSVVGLIGGALLALRIIIGGDFLDYYLPALFLLVSIFQLLFSKRIFYANQYKTLSNLYGVSEWKRTIEFTDDEIVFLDHTSVTKLPYHNIQKIKEKNNMVTICFKNNLAVRLYKDTFTEGTWEECKEKINTMRQ